MSEAFVELGDAINDLRFVDVDIALRRGQHIDRDDAESYAYLLDARNVLEPFYNRYACELVHRTDGYFFLLPLGEKVPRRLLGIPEMIVGQAAALLYLDPSTIERGGILTKDDILSHLAAVMGTDALMAAFNPKRKRMDERVAQETVRQRTSEALRKLAQLGFVTQLEDGQIRLRGALMRFADPVRGAGSPREALEKLIARGEIALPEDASQLDSAETSNNDAPTSEPQQAGDEDGAVAAVDDEREPFLDVGADDDVDDAAGATGEALRARSAVGARVLVPGSNTYDSEFPVESESAPDDEEHEYETLTNERSDTGEDLGPDDTSSDTQYTHAPRPRAGAQATDTSAEWDPTFDDFD